MDLSLVHGIFRRRYKRFLADIDYDGKVVTAHVPNTGSMMSLLTPGIDAWLAPARSPQRKLPFTLTLLGVGAGAGNGAGTGTSAGSGISNGTNNGGLALVDTSLPNAVVAEGIAVGAIPELAGYDHAQREVMYGSRRSRIDILLTSPHRPPCYVEVKNITMASRHASGQADFPDAPTERGLKHLAELEDVARSGSRAVQFYLLSRTDCDRAGIANDIDPHYAEALTRAVAAGVEVIVYRADISPRHVTVGKRCSFITPKK